MFRYYLVSNAGLEVIKASKSVYRPVPDKHRRGVWVSLSKAHSDPLLWACVCEYCRMKELENE